VRYARCMASGTGRAPTRRGAAVVVAALLVVGAACGSTGEDTTVVRVVDGDTLSVAGDVRVRLIGIDTPEVDQDACYADAATTRLAELAGPGSAVRLVHDVERHDRYGRTLAYVYRLQDGLFVNLALARDGYALPLTVPPNVAHADDVVAVSAEARRAGRGLWSACPDAGRDADGRAGASDSTPGAEAADPGSGAPQTSAGSGGTRCDPAYPDVCIPPSPPDLDCGQIAHRHLRVLAPDPHRLDGDRDGVGCES
jgi:micrococcal nuclease